MSVQVFYKNKAKLSDLGVVALFANEKFEIKKIVGRIFLNILGKLSIVK